MVWVRTVKAVPRDQVSDEPDEWNYFDDRELAHSKGSAVCMTCEHFRYHATKSCVTLLTCPIHQRLIQQGEHLTKRCNRWQKKRVLEIGWAPEVA